VPPVYLIYELVCVNFIYKLTSKQLLSPDCVLEEGPSRETGSYSKLLNQSRNFSFSDYIVR
jgi:hypothetical protein